MGLIKSTNEKFMESQSRIRKAQMEVDRGLRDYNSNLQESVQLLKVSLKENNIEKARTFALQVKQLDSVIKGLQDYKLYLAAISQSLKYSKTQQEMMKALSNSAKDLQKSLPNEKQLARVEEQFQIIAESSDKAIDILSNQLTEVSNNVNSKAKTTDVDVDKIIQSFKEIIAKEEESPKVSDATQDKEIDDLIKRLTK
jgi:hypothetical protein